MDYVDNEGRQHLRVLRSTRFTRRYNCTQYYRSCIGITTEYENCGDMAVICYGQCIHHYCKHCSESRHKYPTRRNYSIEV